MALKGSRGGREFDKFVADGSGNTGIRVVTTAHETIESSSGTVNISSTGTTGQQILAAVDVTGKQRIGLQFFNAGAVTATFMVYGSLQSSPGTYAATKYTQIGDSIEVTASNDSAYKSIATTPLKWVLIHAKVASSNADCSVYLSAD
tara:strand:- start:71 stop:511 length:441 start_codon:yes stop_codon:yes gene_type:complete